MQFFLYLCIGLWESSLIRPRHISLFIVELPPRIKNRLTLLLSNNFDFTVEDISEIYRLRWAIESLYKQLKQNFPLHFFYGDSVNAIQIQTWVVLIANLLLTVLSRSIKRRCAFSQVVAMVRLTLMYYIDFIAFMENPDKTWNDIEAKTVGKSPPQPSIFD